MSGTVAETLDMLLKLVLAVVLGGVIGYERETHGRPAGLRTHILVCLGAAIFTIVSISFAGRTSDPSRIASQVVTGIGFLGAGTIIRQGNVVRGLTTAASLWTVAAIGVAVGVGGTLYWLAIAGTFVVFLTLGFINTMEKRLLARLQARELVVTMRGPHVLVSSIMEAAISAGAEVRSVWTEAADEPGCRSYRLRLKFPTTVDPSAVAAEVGHVEGVVGFEWD